MCQTLYFCPGPDRADSPCTASYNYKKPLFISYWKTEKGSHSYTMLWKLNHPNIFQEDVFSGQQRWGYFISVFSHLATHKVPASTEKSTIRYFSFPSGLGNLFCKDRIAWTNLNNLRQAINNVGIIFWSLTEVPEIPGPDVKLMFSTV